jgi:hypothetical protein
MEPDGIPSPVIEAQRRFDLGLATALKSRPLLQVLKLAISMAWSPRTC